MRIDDLKDWMAQADDAILQVNQIEGAVDDAITDLDYIADELKELANVVEMLEERVNDLSGATSRQIRAKASQMAQITKTLDASL